MNSWAGRLIRQLQTAVICQWKMRIDGHLPKVAVEIRDIAAVTAPERVLCGFANCAACIARAFDCDIDVMFRAAVPRQRDAAKIFGHAFECDIGVFRQFV